MCLTRRFFRRATHSGSGHPPHCALVDIPMADDQLRADCAEHEAQRRVTGCRRARRLPACGDLPLLRCTAVPAAIV